jgi:hypothetical protein
MNYSNDDPIDPGADAADSIPSWMKKRNLLRSLQLGDRELDPEDAFFEEDASPYDLYFQGGPEPKTVAGPTGVGLMIVRVTRMYQVYAVKPDGRWQKKIGEFSEQPRGTDWSDRKKGFFDSAGNNVSEVFYVDALRRGDPTLYTLRLAGPETGIVKDWGNRAERLMGPDGRLPLWGARWRWFVEEVEGRRQGEIYHNWAFDPHPLGRFRDGTPEAVTDEEYRLARSYARGAAPEPRQGGTTFTSGRQGDLPAPPAPPPLSSADYGFSGDELPDWI